MIMIIIYRGPKAAIATDPELWVPDETACLPEQSFVATGRGVTLEVGGCDGPRCKALCRRHEVGSVTLEARGVE